MDHREATEAFFAAYAARSNDALRTPPIEDIAGFEAAFAPYFVGASPRGVMGSPNDAAMTEAMRAGFARYREIGGKAMRVTRVKTTALDDFHVQARVDWEFDYVRPADGRRGTIAFQNIYYLSFALGEPKIFACITPDEEQAMREHGLI
jgi:hypothetical protein